MTYLTQKNDFLTLKPTFFNLIQSDKVKWWVHVTLIEGYLRAAKNNTTKIYRFLIKV